MQLGPAVRYITRWPADADGVTLWEALILELSPDKQFVRVLWGYRADGQADQEWLLAADFAASIVGEAPLLSPPTTPVPPPTASPLRTRQPWQP